MRRPIAKQRRAEPDEGPKVAPEPARLVVEAKGEFRGSALSELFDYELDLSPVHLHMEAIRSRLRDISAAIVDRKPIPFTAELKTLADSLNTIASWVEEQPGTNDDPRPVSFASIPALQLPILLHVARHQGATLAELADGLNLRRNNLSRIALVRTVENLVQEGLIELRLRPLLRIRELWMKPENAEALLSIYGDGSSDIDFAKASDFLIQDDIPPANEYLARQNSDLVSPVTVHDNSVPGEPTTPAGAAGLPRPRSALPAPQAGHGLTRAAAPAPHGSEWPVPGWGKFRDQGGVKKHHAIVDYLRDRWKPFLDATGAAVTLEILEQKDPAAGTALRRYLERHPMPSDLRFLPHDQLMSELAERPTRLVAVAVCARCKPDMC